MCTYLKNMGGYKHKDFKGKSFNDIKKMFDKAYKRVNTFVAMDSEVVESSGKEAVSKKRAGEKLSEESVKRQKLEDDAEKAELKLCLEIAPNDDKAINIEPLATKSLIVDWETQILGEIDLIRYESIYDKSYGPLSRRDIKYNTFFNVEICHLSLYEKKQHVFNVLDPKFVKVAFFELVKRHELIPLSGRKALNCLRFLPQGEIPESKFVVALGFVLIVEYLRLDSPHTSSQKYSSSVKLLHVPFISLNVGLANNSGVSVLTFSRFITKAEKSNVVFVSSSNDSRGSCLLARLLNQGASITLLVFHAVVVVVSLGALVDSCSFPDLILLDPCGTEHLLAPSVYLKGTDQRCQDDRVLQLVEFVV
ncbi:hypothetical protein Tco_0847218 [Tanacetum coccineum]